MITPGAVYGPMLPAVAAAPDDRNVWLVLADMLQDHDDPRAALVRLRLALLDAAAGVVPPAEPGTSRPRGVPFLGGWPGLLAATVIFRDATVGWGQGFDHGADPPIEPRLVRYELYACRLLTLAERNPAELPPAERDAIGGSYGDYRRRVRDTFPVTRAYAIMRDACRVRRRYPGRMATAAAVAAGPALIRRYGSRWVEYCVAARCAAVTTRAARDDVRAAYAAVDTAFDADPAAAPYTPTSAKRLKYLARRRAREGPK